MDGVFYLQLALAVALVVYLVHSTKTREAPRVAMGKEAQRELEKLRHLRQIKLTEPLSEKTRPTSFADVVGQEDGIKALRACLCGPNPQHVIMYGPPGVGKTTAARLVLEEAKKNPASPFGPESAFVEIDATTLRFDERGIADPLIGSVHDPIYQGAGPLGMAGIPQPKPGAVTKAHGGILFIDEIGELHPVQMNKLLKVLEDRKVFLESAYYSRDDSSIPAYIHDIFQNGLPADFRLVAATTRPPEEIPQALRSRCAEVFFRALGPGEIARISEIAASKAGVSLEEGAKLLLRDYASNGREVVNMLEIAAGLALSEGRTNVTSEDVEWVISFSQLAPRQKKRSSGQPAIGVALGLAVLGPGLASVIDVEAQSIPASGQRGEITVTGIIEEEELGHRGRTLRRKSMVYASVENVRTALRVVTDADPFAHDIHVNFPGGVPVDGPSAGLAIAAAVYSAIKRVPLEASTAMTGEISITGAVRPVGGIEDKIRAGREAGLNRVLIPRDNWQERFARTAGIEVIPVSSLEEALALAVDGSAPVRSRAVASAAASPETARVSRLQGFSDQA